MQHVVGKTVVISGNYIAFTLYNIFRLKTESQNHYAQSELLHALTQ